MSTNLSALQRLQAMHKPVDATTAKTKTAEAVEAVHKVVETVSCVGKNIALSNLLTKVSTNSKTADTIEDKIEARRSQGLYNVSENLVALDGIDGEEVVTKLRALDYALLAKTPDIGILTIKIRKNLEQYPELTHILTDEQLGIICSGVLFHANVSTEPKSKAAKSAAATKRIQELSLDTNINDI